MSPAKRGEGASNSAQLCRDMWWSLTPASPCPYMETTELHSVFVRIWLSRCEGCQYSEFTSMGEPKSSRSRKAVGSRKKVRLLIKRERRHLLVRLRSADMGVFASFVKKYMEENKAVQLSFYEDRRRLWGAWNERGRLSALLSFLLSGFCDLLGCHTKGGERFARFLIGWHNFVGTLACNPEGDPELEQQWSVLTNELDCDVSSESRSALVFAVARVGYTFLQKQVGNNV